MLQEWVTQVCAWMGRGSAGCRVLADAAGHVIAGEDFIHAEEFNLQPLEDDCKLLGSVLDDTLKTEVGAAGFSKLQKIRWAQPWAGLVLRRRRARDAEEAVIRR